MSFLEVVKLSQLIDAMLFVWLGFQGINFNIYSEL